jgi:hypothetical protein
MAWGRRCFVRSIACAGAFAALGLAPANADADGTLTAEYDFDYKGTFTYQPSNPGVWQHVVDLHVQERSVYGVEVRGGQPQLTRRTGSLAVSGTVTATYAPPNQQLSCTGTLSLRAGADPRRFLQPYVGYDAVRKSFQVIGSVPAGNYIQSTGTGECGVPPNGGVFGPIQNPSASGPSGDWQTPALYALPNRFHTAVPFRVDSFKSPSGQSEVSLLGTLSLTNTTAPPPDPDRFPYGPQDDPAAARAALRAAIERAKVPCIREGAGLLLVGAGGLLTGLPGSTGLTLAVAGGLTAAFASHACAEAIKDVVTSYQRAQALAGASAAGAAGAGASPSAGSGARARSSALPSCARRPASVRSFCHALRSAYAELIAAYRATAEADAALTAAVRGRRAASVLRTLEGRAGAALARQDSAGTRVARLLRAQRIQARISRAQSARVITALVRLLGARRVPRARLGALAGDALVPSPLNMLRSLERPAG